MLTRTVCAISACLALTLSGCASVPSLQASGQEPDKEWLREQHLAGYVKCQINYAVRTVLAEYAADRERLQREDPENAAAKLGNNIDWLNDWGAVVTMKIVVNEKSAIAPSIAFVDTLSNSVAKFPENGNVTIGRNRQAAFGGSFNSEAQRTETITFNYSFADLLSEKDGPVSKASCGVQDGHYIDGDLKFDEFMNSKILLARTGAVVSQGKAAPFTTFTYEVQFIVSKNGAVNPTWKLMSAAVGSSTPLFSGTRTRTDSLAITLGKVAPAASGPPQPSQEVRDAQLAAMIGQSVAEALRHNP